ncbi:MAG: TetR/AcrR family transcriptional regulator [Lachnospiraceae bacterium]|nr:TetR/AcrR family transcriptional regulator [Lachnospiraceae bacterium]
MPRKDSKNTKGRIINAAWELFYEQGYETTTIDDIVERSETSKGSFYHYFDSKDSLLSSLSYLFDKKYEELIPSLTDFSSSQEKLVYLNHELFLMIENRVPLDLLARLLSTQLITTGEKHLLDHGRTYFRLLRQIVIEGQRSGEFRQDVSVNEIVKGYALFERAILYDWCICNGEYSLYQYSGTLLPMFLRGFLSSTEA